MGRDERLQDRSLTQEVFDLGNRLGKIPAASPALTKALAEAKVSHSSGATSSHFSPFSFFNPYEGTKLTDMRFAEGNRKHENDNPVYADANWLKAFNARDVKFFRDRAGHAMEHLIDEMRGKDDEDPGGNLGAVGWFQEVMAFVKKNDPFFYACIQGKFNVNDTKAELAFAREDTP